MLPPAPGWEGASLELGNGNLIALPCLVFCLCALTNSPVNLCNYPRAKQERRGACPGKGGFLFSRLPKLPPSSCPAVGKCRGVERRSLGPGRELMLLFLVTAGESRPEQPDGNAALGSRVCVCEADPGCTPPSFPEPGSSLPARHPGLSAKGLQMLCY